VFAVWLVLLVGTVWFWVWTGGDHLARHRGAVDKPLSDTESATGVPVRV
jgi:hypothetical protein